MGTYTKWHLTTVQEIFIVRDIKWRDIKATSEVAKGRAFCDKQEIGAEKIRHVGSEKSRLGSGYLTVCSVARYTAIIPPRT